MAALNFPDPSVTQEFEAAGILWTWNATLGVWSSEAGEIPGGGGDVSVDVGDTRPSLPSQGDLWFCTAERDDGGGRLYVYFIDEDSGQWVDVSQPGGGGGDGGGLTQDEANALYLSKTTADTAAGEITFEKETTHEDGVSVTGGNVTLNPGQFKQGVTTAAATPGSGVQVNGFVRAYCNESDFPEDDRNGKQPFQIVSAPTASEAKSIKISLNASGSAFFKGVTQHNNGISLTGETTPGISCGFYKTTNPSRSLSFVTGDLSRTNGNVYGFSTVIDDSSINLTGDCTVILYDGQAESALDADFVSYRTQAVGLTGTVGNWTGYWVSPGAPGNTNATPTKLIGFKSELSASITHGQTFNFYAASSAPSRITNLQTTFSSFLDISELDQTDSEGNPINWEQPTAATVGTGIYRNESGALCFARNGECALEIGNGQAIGNLIDKLESIEARLAALEGA